MKKIIYTCFVVLVTFLIGFALGYLAHANRDVFSFGEKPVCLDGTEPDKNGCCAGEIYTDMNDLGFNCCPEVGGDCFPPIR